PEAVAVAVPIPVPVAVEVRRAHEAPVVEVAPVAAGPTVEAEAETGVEAEARAVEAGVVAGRAPADVARTPVPVHPGRRPDVTGLPDPAVGGQIVPAPVVIGHPAPGLVGNPGHAGRRVDPAAVVKGTPAGGHPRPPVRRAVDGDPGAVAGERRRLIAQVVVDVGLIGGSVLVVHLARPALERVEAAGLAHLDFRVAVAVDDRLLVGAHALG